MRFFGSINNRLAENIAPPTPTEGMGATELCYSDRHAYTVVKINSPSTIVLQRDRATRSDSNGMSESQSYLYERDYFGATVIVTKRRDGRWKIRNSTTVIMLGERDEYYDYGF